jgi:hypothetical protein
MYHWIVYYMNFYLDKVLKNCIGDSPFIFNLDCKIVHKFLIVGIRLFQILTDGIKDFSLIRSLHMGIT